MSDGGRIEGLPTLWIHGEEDTIVPLAATREAMELIRGDRFSEKFYPGARHEIFNETNCGEVLDALAAFLNAALAR